MTGVQTCALPIFLLLTVDMSAQPTQQEDGSYAYPALPAEKVAEQKKLAEDLLAQLQGAEDLPAKFDELMKAHSEDSGLESNPDGYTCWRYGTIYSNRRYQ